jgi:hypothetical protein
MPKAKPPAHPHPNGPKPPTHPKPPHQGHADTIKTRCFIVGSQPPGQAKHCSTVAGNGLLSELCAYQAHRYRQRGREAHRRRGKRGKVNDQRTSVKARHSDSHAPRRGPPDSTKFDWPT